jgi:RimJ/RimL family protein N-acetyltransferase
VRLVPLRFEHVDALFAATHDPELWRWTVAHVETRDDLRRFVEKALLQTRQGTSVAFLTLEHATGAVAGTTRFMNYSRVDRRVEIGSTVVAKAWQRTQHRGQEAACADPRLRATPLLRVELKTA